MQAHTNVQEANHAVNHNVLGSGLASAAGSSHADSRKYITGSGAISIAFLLELLKLNTEMKNDMATLTEQTTTCQSKIIDNQASAQKSLYDNQAGEMVLQAASAVVGAITSGINLGAVFLTGPTAEKQQEAEGASGQLESYNNMKSDPEFSAGDNLGEGEERYAKYASDKTYTAKEKQDIDALRDRLVEGRVTGSKEFVDENGNRTTDMTKAKMKVGDKSYDVADILKTSTPEERADIGKNFAKRRDTANEDFRTAYQAWNQKLQNIQTGTMIVKSGSESVTAGLQSEKKSAEGAASAASQEAQGTASILNDAKRTTDDARSTGQQNATQALQTIREIVASQVRG